MGEWDFVGSNTKEFTHCFHRYPATMISHVARKLIADYGRPGMNLLDPFCGSGTSLVEARLAGLNGFGFDLNHMARRISIVKTRDYNMTDLEKFVKKLEAEIPSIKLLGVEDSIKLSGFDTQSIRSWYPDKSIREIASILQYLDDNYFDQRSDWFARLTLSDCLRDVAFQRNHEFKLYRIPIEERDSFYVPLLQLFLKKLVRNFHGVEQYRRELGHRGFLRSTMSNVTNQNTVITELFTGTPTFDIVVTSPPYGDSETTVAYAQFSWLTNVWLGLDVRNPGQLDRDLMGGHVSTDIQQTGCGVIDLSISKIEKVCRKRAREVYSFYRDYKLSIKHISSNVKINGFVCFVVGNRTVKDEYLRTDLFTKEIFEDCGFEHITTEIRKLPNTRMPSKVSPTGKKGKTAPTMQKEYIVICKKLE